MPSLSAVPSEGETDVSFLTRTYLCFEFARYFVGTRAVDPPPLKSNTSRTHNLIHDATGTTAMTATMFLRRNDSEENINYTTNRNTAVVQETTIFGQCK